MEKAGPGINWSAVAEAAFEFELTRDQPIESDGESPVSEVDLIRKQIEARKAEIKVLRRLARLKAVEEYARRVIADREQADSRSPIAIKTGRDTT